MFDRNLKAELNDLMNIEAGRPLTSEELATINEIYSVARVQRLALDKRSNELKAIETAAETALIDAMRRQKLTTLDTAALRIVLNPVKYKPHVQSWNDFTMYMLQTRDLSLLERRPSSSAIAERWDHGNVVPGVEKFPVYTLSRITRS